MTQKIKKRINLSVSEDLNETLNKLAKRDDVPVATKTLELLKEALLIVEDDVFNQIAKKRDSKKIKYIEHERAWK